MLFGEFSRGRLQGVIVRGEGFIPLQQQLQHLGWLAEAPVGGQEDVDVCGLQLAIVGGQGLHEPFHSARLHEAHSHRFPFQVRYFVLGVL